jgi:hypothetical protein
MRRSPNTHRLPHDDVDVHLRASPRSKKSEPGSQMFLRNPVRSPSSRAPSVDEGEFGGHHDRRLQSAIDRTLVGEDPVHAIGGLAVSLLGLKPQPHMNAADHEDVVLQFYLTRCFRHQAIA